MAYVSPLTYAKDVMNHAALGTGSLNPGLDLVVLLVSGVLFLVPSVLMHRRSHRLGY